MTLKEKAYAWVAYMMTHRPEEIHRLLKYGTPSDELIKLSQRRVFMHVAKNEIRGITFPVSLSKSAGQKLLYKAAQDIQAFKKAIPVGMYYTFLEAKAIIKCRRADATANVLMVAEAVFSRGAAEFKPEILFSFDSINAWIKTKYGKTLGYQTIRKALELLEEKSFISVREWGQKNVRHKATKIYVNLDSSWRKMEFCDADEWITSNYAAMNAVYLRESSARQDVCAAQIHKYAEELIEQENSSDPVWEPAGRLFPAADDKILTKAQVVPVEEEGLWDDAYIDRLLGRLVPAVQENGSSYRESSGSVRQYSLE